MKNMDMTPYRAIVNCMAVNHDDVTVAGYDNGALRFMVCVAIECVLYRVNHDDVTVAHVSWCVLLCSLVFVLV